jgi:DNA-binding CsgD family transcriptional regulator
MINAGCIRSYAGAVHFQRLQATTRKWLGRPLATFARLLAARHSGFLVDYDVFTPEEIRDDPFYRDVLRPRGLGWTTGTAIPLPTGDNFAIALEREYVHGPVERARIHTLDELRPHLARSALLSARLQLERARGATEALALIGLPTLVLNEQGKVLAANYLIEALSGYLHWRAQDRVALKDGGADKLLKEAIATLDCEGGQAVSSFPVRGAEAAMVAHMLPIRRTARDIFVRCAAVLVMTPVTAPQAPPVELVQSLFDLTPAEARVARSLASGKTVADIATDGGISRNTVRTQLDRVMEKTGCNRQAEVVPLLTGLSPSRA